MSEAPLAEWLLYPPGSLWIAFTRCNCYRFHEVRIFRDELAARRFADSEYGWEVAEAADGEEVAI